ncbi:phage side tail fiber protein [Escherichia coli]|nr:putative tail fiber protein [Escherichia coli 1303]CAD5534603.1 Tail fiber protein [Escherichia coli]SQM52088.1 Tail fiber protein [Escherichia coli]GCF97158.1 phage side tail fiber protein [Escherichia coli]GCG20702.1 phage side tail fiber protein [Escherichia coli]
MAVKISGVLKDGTGKPVQNCTIQLKAKRNSTTVVVNTLASENPDEAGRYSMDVEYGQYSVILLVEGFPPSHAGTITVYEDSRPGTLNDFLGAMTEDDVRPEALRRFELMVEEVARNASAVAQNTAAAKKSAGDASTSAREAATHATDAADSARAASTSAGQAASSAQEASSGAETASVKATEASKSAAAAESSKSAAATSAVAAKTSETNAAASQQSAATSASTATAKASEAATSAREAEASKEAAKSSETNASSSASGAASSATAAENAAKEAKTSEMNARSSETAAAQSASAAAGSEKAAASLAGEASGKAEEAAGSAAVAAQSKSSAESAATRAENAARRAEEIASAVSLEDASTTTKGVVRLSNRTDSTSQTEAATSLAVSNVMNEVKTKASLDSPVFTGTPMTPTPPDDASGLETVNAAFVRKLLAALVGSSPETLDTLNELAEALGNDPAFSVTIMKMLAGKQPLNPVLTALGSLPSGEDGFPSFSGNGQCSLAPVSEKGKQLLSQSTAEEMCDVLGINGNSGNSAAGGNYGLQSGIYDRTQGRAAVAGSLGFGHIFTKGDVLSFSSKEVLLDWISNATPGRYTVSADCEIIPEVQFTGVIDLFFADEMRNNLTVPLMLKMAVFYGMNGELYRATYDAIHGPSLSEWVKINIDLYDIAKILSMTTNDNYGDPYAGSITLAAFNSRGSTKTASVVRGQYYPGSVLTPVVFSVPEGALSSPKIGLSGTEKHTLPGVYRALSGTPDYTGEGEFIIAAFIRTM